MPSQFSLADFNRIASGAYNAGQIDVATAEDGSKSLVKVNNHVWFPLRNNVQLSPERVLEVKEAFIAALRDEAVLGREELNKIRKKLGISGADAAVDASKVGKLVKKRFTPLTRAQVRSILDTYAAGGRGWTQLSYDRISKEDEAAARRTAQAGAWTVFWRDAANAKAPTRADSAAAHDMLDAASLLTGEKSLKDINVARRLRITNPAAGADRDLATSKLQAGFERLFTEAFKLLDAGARESNRFVLCGTKVKLVKDAGGNLSAVLGTGVTATAVRLGANASAFMDRLVARAAEDAETLGGTVARTLLDKVFDRDIESRITVSDRVSLTRRFAAKIIAGYAAHATWGAPEFTADDLMTGNYNTGCLVQIAVRALEGNRSDIFRTKQQFDAFHAQIVTDNAGLPQEIKDMIAQVADIPLEKPSAGNGELLVRGQLAGDIQGQVDRIPSRGNAPALPPGIGGIAGIKDFMADLIFSDETMVADVLATRPGETMRGILSDDKKCAALAEIIKDRTVIDHAVAPQIADVVKEGFDKMIDVLDGAFRDSTRTADGTEETLAEAAQKPNFVGRLSAFIKDQSRLPGEKLAPFDDFIQTMSTKGCEKLQKFINEVFAVNVANASETGAITTDPYGQMDGAAIAKELKGKSLNQILDAASTSDAPGQVGFFKQVISTYFTQLARADKRSAFAASLRYAQTFEFGDKQGAELVSAKKAAVNSFAGAILKGAGPILQKMMQGLPKEVMGDFADALEDMKSNLAPIPRKIVQAHLMKMMQESHQRYVTPKTDGNGEFESDTEITEIVVQRSLGAASVGEAFLCTFKYKERQKGGAGTDDRGEQETQCVVKIMRHDAEKRMLDEAKIFTAAAAKIPGMAKTWEGQLRQYKTEFDFQNEADNVRKGQKLYCGNLGHLAKGVSSMKMSPLAVAKKDVMVAELAPGKTADKFFKERVAEIRNAASGVFARDPATGRVLWQDGPIDPATGKPVKFPVPRQDIPTLAIVNLQAWFSTGYSSLQNACVGIREAAKAWFHQALFGPGQFHGDAHAGNIMLYGPNATFIDFGNLYTLNSARPDGVNERTELLRVILGAAFRSPEFVLTGFERLMSFEGRRALDAKRDKARAILNAVLDSSKGSFSFNIVYRLQAAVVELQKLGLELPPQINCFILSLVRLSNTVAEINTIMNQCQAMIHASDAIPLAVPQDKLDLVGHMFAKYFQAMNGTEPAAKKKKKIDEVIEDFQGGMYGVDGQAITLEMFKPGGAFYDEVANRLDAAEDKVAAAEKLLGIISQHDCGGAWAGVCKPLYDQMDAFRTAYTSSAKPEEKAEAVRAFVQVFSETEHTLASLVAPSLVIIRDFRSQLSPPDAFATALTDVIAENFDALDKSFSLKEQFAFVRAAEPVLKNELGLDDEQMIDANAVKDAIQKDAQQMGGDTGYQVDIGV